MSNADSSEDGWSRAQKINAAGWVVGGFLILTGVASILSLGDGGVIDAIRAVVGGAILFAGGVLALPKTREYVVTPLSETTGLQISGIMVAGLVFLSFVAGAAALPTSNQGTDPGAQSLEASAGTPEATATESPGVTSSETPEQTPTAAPPSTEASVVTPTMTPTPTVGSIATATATATARPTATAPPAPTATATPRQTATSKPTATPIATATPSPTPTPTATPAQSSSVVALDVIQYTADGNDNEYPNNEWVQFENQGKQTISLSGWTVKDDSGRYSYRFGGVTLNPGDTVRLYTGEGSDTDSKVYWGYKSAVWNDTGDVVRLIDDDGKLIVEFAYDGDSADGQASPN